MTAEPFMTTDSSALQTLLPAVNNKTPGGRCNHNAVISPRATCSLGMQARHSTAQHSTAQHSTAQHTLMLEVQRNAARQPLLLPCFITWSCCSGFSRHLTSKPLNTAGLTNSLSQTSGKTFGKQMGRSSPGCLRAAPAK